MSIGWLEFGPDPSQKKKKKKIGPFTFAHERPSKGHRPSPKRIDKAAWRLGPYEIRCNPIGFRSFVRPKLQNGLQNPLSLLFLFRLAQCNSSPLPLHQAHFLSFSCWPSLEKNSRSSPFLFLLLLPPFDGVAKEQNSSNFHAEQTTPHRTNSGSSVRRPASKNSGEREVSFFSKRHTSFAQCEVDVDGLVVIWCWLVSTVGISTTE